MAITDSTKRFSDRVDNYVKYRPGYPPDVLSHLIKFCKLDGQSAIADIGSGTGIFTKLLLEAGYTVFAVEPNESMRKAAEEWLSDYPKLKSIAGTAEATTLPGKSVDAIVCAQAFHWFNNEQTKKEFSRILIDDGTCALIWNNRRIDADEFAMAYERLLKQDNIDYNHVNHQNLTVADFANFFKDGRYELATFDNAQVFDLDGLLGRAFSSSYVPPQDTKEGIRFSDDLKMIFHQYQVDGQVTFYYRTEVYTGKV